MMNDDVIIFCLNKLKWCSINYLPFFFLISPQSISSVLKRKRKGNWIGWERQTRALKLQANTDRIQQTLRKNE